MFVTSGPGVAQIKAIFLDQTYAIFPSPNYLLRSPSSGIVTKGLWQTNLELWLLPMFRVALYDFCFVGTISFPYLDPNRVHHLGTFYRLAFGAMRCYGQCSPVVLHFIMGTSGTTSKWSRSNLSFRLFKQKNDIRIKQRWFDAGKCNIVFAILMTSCHIFWYSWFPRSKFSTLECRHRVRLRNTLGK